MILMVLVQSKDTFAQQRALFPYLYQSTSNGNSVSSPFQSLDFSTFDQGFANYPNSIPIDLIAGKNVWLDEQGNPVFYIIGSYIVDKNGKVLDQMVNFVRTHPDIYVPNYEIRSNVNTLIIPFPGQNPSCVTKFYIFTLSDPISGPSTNTNSLEPFYSILDLNQNVQGVHANGKLDNFFSGTATAQKIPLPANFVGGPFNTNVPPFVDYDGFQQFNVHMNATSIPGSNDYLLVYSHITDIYFYRVSPSGIQLVGTYSDFFFKGLTTVNGTDEYYYFRNKGQSLSSELEIHPLSGGGFRMAYAVEAAQNPAIQQGAPIPPKVPGFVISILDFDANFNYIAQSKKVIEFSRGYNEGSLSPRPSGLQFDASGQVLYISKRRNANYSNQVLVKADLTTNPVTIATLDGFTGLTSSQLDAFSRSHIEPDGQGNLIMTNGSDILKCTNPNNGGNNWVLEQNAFTTQGSIALTKGITSTNNYGSYTINGSRLSSNQYAAWRGFDATSYTVNVNQTWTNQSNPFNNPYGIYIKDTLVVASGKTLTINNMSVRFSPSGRILVEPGGKLVTNGATLSHDNRCSDAPWHGIQVFGNINQPQSPLHQGILQLNNSTVSYAREAVQLWQEGNYSSTGGIVQAINTLFLNNSRSVEFISYPYFSQSKFENCNFEANHLFPASHVNFRAFATMWNVRGLGYFGCDFEVNHPDLVFANQHVFANRGYGILSHDAQYTVTYYCPAGFDPCPAKQNGSFKNLKYAISAHSMEQDRPITVAYTDFKDNQWGIHNVGVNNAVLVRNNFELGKQWSTYSDGANYMGPSEGISVYTGTGFRIEENNFNPSSEFTNIAVGVVVSAAGEADNQTFRNNFNGIQYGSVSNYTNREPWGQTGLRFLCGNYNEVWFDNAIIPVKTPKYEGIRLHQLEGLEFSGNEHSAGNNFTQNPIYPEGNYLNHTDNSIIYWWHQGSGYPNNISVNRVSRTNQSYIDECKSNFNDGYTEERLDGTTELPDLLMQYGTLEAEYGNLLHNMHQLLDGGNTPSLLQTIYETWPQEAWDLRSDLLAHSPYLSQDALREAAHNENFPRAMLLEVLLANPDAHRNDHGFIDFLQDELQPALPAYMIDLMVLSWEDMTLRTVLEAKMAAKAGDMAWRLNQIVNYYLTDSINQDAQVEFWLNRALDLRSKYRLAWHHARKNQYSNALAVTNGLSTQYTLNQPQLAEKARFESLIEFKQSLGTTGLAGVNGAGISWLENFVASTDDAFDYSLALAQNALQHQGSAQMHQVHLPQSEPQGRRAASKEQALQQLREELTVLKLYPNPANTYATLAFELPKEVEQATLVIADLSGKVLNRIPLSGQKGQQLIDTRNLPVGMYITSVVCKTGILKRDKLVISH